MGEKRLVSVPPVAGAAGMISLFPVVQLMPGGGVLPDCVEVSRINSKQASGFLFPFPLLSFPADGVQLRGVADSCRMITGNGRKQADFSAGAVLLSVRMICRLYTMIVYNIFC